MKKVGKKVSYVLASMLIINTFSGCAIKPVQKEVKENTPASDEFTDFEIVEKTSAIVLNKDTVYNAQEVLDVLSNYYDFSVWEYDDILTTYAKETDRQIYAAGLYAKLKDEGLSDEIIIDELDKLMEVTNSQTNVSKIAEKQVLPNLSSTVTEKDFVTEKYYPLAKFVHIHTCDELHTPIGSQVFCDGIYEKEQSQRMAKKIKAVLDTYEDEKLYQAFDRIKSKQNLQDYIDELEYVYAFAAMPTDGLVADFYNTYFKQLQGTVETRENVFDFYYNLAVVVHEMNCNLEHEENEYFRISCGNVDYILRYEP